MTEQTGNRSPLRSKVCSVLRERVCVRVLSLYGCSCVGWRDPCLPICVCDSPANLLTNVAELARKLNGGYIRLPSITGTMPHGHSSGVLFSWLDELCCVRAFQFSWYFCDIFNSCSFKLRTCGHLEKVEKFTTSPSIFYQLNRRNCNFNIFVFVLQSQ